MQSETETSPSYVGTTYAAKMLHMSVGTVQKLVEKGVLSAFLTSGGHRRISYESVIKYGQSNKIRVAGTALDKQLTADDISICVLFWDKEDAANIAEIIKTGTIQVVADPMRLIRSADEIAHIFIDARIEWINWQQMERTFSNVHYVIYNSKIFNSLTRQHLEKVASLIDDDISIALLNGYRLGLKLNFSEQRAHSISNIVRQ